ncbi:hypothetical protein [Acinetobacter stercoris]|uniref:DUF2514 family protein n=1 Tax=Acinetobacter stercoris TaxID=2126983 RepID=A0A2U3MUL3_9GAMM|nr:hypothetical protein [Acinetobacter stercoris]SPL69130.1 hypothetical protein KPC_0308 [Acinetobacter stercoris]
MTFLILISKWREILIGLLAFLLLVCLFLLNSKTGQIEKYKQAEIIQQAEIDKAKSAAALQEKQWSEQLLKAEQNYNAKLKQIQSDADSARTAANSLSEQLKVANSRMSTASREASDEYCAALGNVFERSIEEYTKMAKAADEHTADVWRLSDAWSFK